MKNFSAAVLLLLGAGLNYFVWWVISLAPNWQIRYAICIFAASIFALVVNSLAEKGKQ